MPYDGNVRYVTPRRSQYLEWLTRTDTNDGALVVGIIGGDEYELGRLPNLKGTAIDIGAHIGIVTCALAADHPELHVIAVEAVPENVEGLRLNVEHNGLGKRVTIIEAAATEPGRKSVKLLWDYRSALNVDQAYTDDSRYIANIFNENASDGDWHTVKAVSLDSLMKDIPTLRLLKIDCEGCEWNVLRSKRVADIETIIGEFHWDNLGLDKLRDLIGATHEVEQMGGSEQVGMFRAVRR